MFQKFCNEALWERELSYIRSRVMDFLILLEKSECQLY